MSLQSRLELLTDLVGADVKSLTLAIGTRVPRVSNFSVTLPTEGQVFEINIDIANATGGGEPWIIRHRVGSELVRTFWPNETGAPRAQATQAEPTLKLFKSVSANYAGLIAQILTTWSGAGSQRHLWGVRSDGNVLVGDGGLTNVQNVTSHLKVIELGATPPAMPPGTVFAEKQV